MSKQVSLLGLLCLMLTACGSQEPTEQRASQSPNATGEQPTTAHATHAPAPRDSSHVSHAAHRDHGSADPHHGESERKLNHRQGQSNHGPHASSKHSKQPNHKPHTRRDDHHTQHTVARVAHSESEAASTDPADIFEKRILPIAKDKNASSCAECHFTGVDLKDFILDDPAKTFAALRAKGMIDIEKPDDSKLLAFINRKPKKTNPLIERVRHKEFTAFRDWIRAAVKDPELLAAKTKTDIGTTLPPEVIRHTRKDRVLSLFVDNVWSQMGRCVSCHSPEHNRKMIARRGKDLVDAISWIVPRDPAATLKELEDGGNIDLEHPADSSLLRKPAGLEEHGGGPKFLAGGPAYQKFLSFLKDYAAVKTNRYRKPSDVPPPEHEFVTLTKQHLRITNVPASYGRAVMQVDLYRWDRDKKNWSKQRWATMLSPIHVKKHMWQSIVSATADNAFPRANELRETPQLPGGRYLAKISIDEDKEPSLTPKAVPKRHFKYIGEVEVNGSWPPGYRSPKTARFPR